MIALALALLAVALGLGLGLGLTREHSAWTELSPSGMPPEARNAHLMAYDPSTGLMIMFGGGGEAANFNDTWAYDPTANIWTELSPPGLPPASRATHSMAYDPVTHRLIMFGGVDDTGVLRNDTWAYDPTVNYWTNLKPAGTLPRARMGPAMAYDTTSRQLIMFGGMAGRVQSVGTIPFGEDLLNDTSAYDPVANTWTDLQPAGGLRPRVRPGHGL